MKFEKQRLYQDGWVIIYGKPEDPKVIPVYAIKTTCEIILLFVLCTFLYVSGISQQNNNVAMTAYMCSQGGMPISGIICNPVLASGTIKWVCNSPDKNISNFTSYLPA